MKTGLNKDKTSKVVEQLNVYLSNLHVLSVKLHNYHWNIIGSHFFTMHLKLEELYNDSAIKTDTIAERILMLGETPFATMREYLDNTILTELKSKSIKENDVITDIMHDFQLTLKHLRALSKLAAEADDEGTVDVCVQDIRYYEKYIWMCSSFNA